MFFGHDIDLRSRVLNRCSKRLVFLVMLACTLLALPVRGAEPTAVSVLRVPPEAIQPQLQTDSRGRVHMIYFKGDPIGGDIFYVRSDDAGATWTAPLQVNNQPNSCIAIGTIRGPRMALGKADRVHVAWMGSKNAEPKVGDATPMLYARLNDAGDVFEPQRNMIQKHPGLDGGGTVAADIEGNVYVIWHAPDAGKGEANRRVWVSRSSDDGKTFAVETAASAATAGCCGCCGLSAMAAAGGRLYILFRTAHETVNREMVLLASDDHGKTFKPIASDPWNVGVCVMSTAHLVAEGKTVLATWETREQIRVAQFTAGSATANAAAVAAAASKCKHSAVAMNSRGEFIVAWAEGTGWNKGGSVGWQIYNKDGTPQGRAGRAEGLPVWDVPAVFATADGGFRVMY